MPRPSHWLAVFCLSVVSLIGTVTAACGSDDTTPTPDAVATAVAETVAVALSPTSESVAAEATVTLAPTHTRVSDSPTSAPSPTGAGGAAGCSDRAAFVRDVTVPDDTSYAGGTSFTKTWRLRNAGTCAWTADYALVFDRGDTMSASASVPLSSAVSPGQTVDLSVNLVAPTTPGSYQGYWKLRNGAGATFGVGTAGDAPFWVKIVVPGAVTPTTSPTATPTGASLTPTGTASATPTQAVGVTATSTAMATQAATATATRAVTPTASASATVTPTPPPPVVYSAGPLDIEQTFPVDLDEGTVSGDTFNTTADIWFEAVTDVERYLTPRNGATIALVGTSAVGRDSCAAAPLSTDRIPMQDLTEGTYVCVYTNGGRYSEFGVTAAAGPSPGTFSIEYTTWEAIP